MCYPSHHDGFDGRPSCRPKSKSTRRIIGLPVSTVQRTTAEAGEANYELGCLSRPISVPLGTLKNRFRLSQIGMEGSCFLTASAKTMNCKHVLCLFLAACFAITGGAGAEIESNLSSDVDKRAHTPNYTTTAHSPDFQHESISRSHIPFALSLNDTKMEDDETENVEPKLPIQHKSSIPFALSLSDTNMKGDDATESLVPKSSHHTRTSSKLSRLPETELVKSSRSTRSSIGIEHSEVDISTRNTMQTGKSTQEIEPLNAFNFEDKQDVAEEESSFFIQRLFQRHGNDDFLLVTSLKTILESIGLAKSVLNHDDHHLNKVEHSSNQTNDLDNKNGHVHTRSIQFQDSVVSISKLQLHETGTPSSDPIIKGSEINKLSANRKQNVQINSNQMSEKKTFRPTLSTKKHRRSVPDSHSHSDHNECLSAKELLTAFRFDHSKSLTYDDFLHLCPALIDQLDGGYCNKKTSHTHSDGHDHKESDPHSHNHHVHNHDGHNHEDEEEHSDHDMVSSDPHTKSFPAKVWLYALFSVAIISVCSLAGIVVIPNMKRTFYNHVLQFLVALAVGTMSGDAMLHLLPHALLSESHHEDHHHSHLSQAARNKTSTNSHDIVHGDVDSSYDASNHMAAMYKGLVALMGIYSFFFLERLFTLFTKNRNGKKKRKARSFLRRKSNGLGKQVCHMVKSSLQNRSDNVPSCDEMVMVVHPNKALKAYADASHEAYLHRCDESLITPPCGPTATPELANGDQPTPVGNAAPCKVGLTLEGIDTNGKTDMVETPLRETAILSDAEIIGPMKETDETGDDEGHGHSHSHMVQDFKGPLSSVAMMVVVGDMIHNFCDGLAIGAAFAGSLAGGLSTSVAVFCHELPHEIGDFAVLVRSGLTMKKAVFYNLVTCIPCFIGALIGLAVGNLGSTSLWIFAAVGGMFLYITLVDLVPEMTSVYTKCGEPWFLHLLLQASGMAVGTTIMLIISVSEESLLTAFQY